MGFTAVEMGSSRKWLVSKQVIRHLGSGVGSLHAQGITKESFRELYGYSSIAERLLPAILHRLGHDTIGPFREHVLFDRLGQAFGATRELDPLSGT
jgi:hypothetical protein